MGQETINNLSYDKASDELLCFGDSIIYRVDSKGSVKKEDIKGHQVVAKDLQCNSFILEGQYDKEVGKLTSDLVFRAL